MEFLGLCSGATPEHTTALLGFTSCSPGECGCPAQLDKVTMASQSCVEMVCPGVTEEFHVVTSPNQDGEGLECS